MDATEIILNSIINASNRERAKYSYLRVGQSIYNCAYSIFPDVVDEIHGTENDCFYHDERIEDFLKEVCRLVEEDLND